MTNESAKAYAELEREVIKMSFNECVQTINTTIGERAISAKKHYDAFYDFVPLQTTLAAVGTLLVCGYLAACIKAMAERRVSRKFYTLILNRVVADLILAASLLLYGFVDQKATGESAATLFVLLAFTMSLQAATISYIALSLLKLYAVARPLHVRGSVHLRTCVKIIIFSWLSFATLLIGFSTAIVFIANVKKHASKEEMQKQSGAVVVRLMMAFPSATYLVTITVYCASVFFIWQAKKLAESFNKDRRDKNPELAERVMRERFKIPLMKLSLSVANLAIFTLPFVAWSLLVAVMDPGLYPKRNVCFTLRNFHTMQVLDSINKNSMLLRVIFDVLIGFAIDTEVRSVLRPLTQLIFRGNSNASTSPSPPASASASTTAITSTDKDKG